MALFRVRHKEDCSIVGVTEEPEPIDLILFCPVEELDNLLLGDAVKTVFRSSPIDMVASWSLSNDLDQHSLRAVAVELAVENLLPGAEVEFAIRNCHDHLPAHDLPLHVSIGVILADAVLLVAGGRGVEGGQQSSCRPSNSTEFIRLR